MQAIASDLKNIIDQHISVLRALPDQEIKDKPSPTKWSQKRNYCHMVDSAQNNIRRFIVAQYEESSRIVYNQDKWVAISHYQEYEFTDLINLWYLLNNHIVVILENMPEEMKQRESQTEALHTLEWLALDYIKHLKHHLHQVLKLKPVAYP